MRMRKSIKGTRIIEYTDEGFAAEELAFAAEILREGGTVAFPTETVYGLGANGLMEKAVEKIFLAKGRPSDNPLILHVSGWKEAVPLVQSIPPLARDLGKAFWPGPLTIVFNKSPIVNNRVTGGLNTVAIRMPDHPAALQLLRKAGVPVAAPSANLSGKPSPTRVEHVIEDLAGKVDVIIDGGKTGVGVESTVIDLSGKQPVLLRPGGITVEMLEEVIGPVQIDPAVLREEAADKIIPKAPGMKYRHYAPEAEAVIVEGAGRSQQEKINSLLQEAISAGKKVGLMVSRENAHAYSRGLVKVMGERQNPATILENIFHCLREFDAAGVDLIVIEGIEATGVGLTIMNRLRKAAGYNIVRGLGSGVRD
jgi:L-threonylcarbamoyladenylate synthase